MKVMLLNGSPHKDGCIFTALNIMTEILHNEGIETEEFFIGKEPIAPCRACLACAKIGRCVINDRVNEFVEKMKECDGLIIGSPVHYAAATGAITTFLDRAFFVGYNPKRGIYAHKPGTAIVNSRRAGTTAALEQLNKYFTISQMPLISGRYWNMTHGWTPEEMLQDKEGVQNLRIVAKNMAYYLKCQKLAKEAGINPPEFDEKVETTNFIR